LKGAGVFMNNSVIEVVASQISLWRIALQIDMYAKCGSMEDIWRVFWKMLLHDVFL
jgi:hypothetical protein